MADTTSIPPAHTAAAVAEADDHEPERSRPKLRRDIVTVIAALNRELFDAFFDYDRSEMRPDATEALRRDASLLTPLLAEFPQITVIVEGHCDERGSAEYNIGLGDHRAARAAAILESFGVPKDRIQTVSYGKESPQCTDAIESCWRRNRRAHLSVRQGPNPPSRVWLNRPAMGRPARPGAVSHNAVHRRTPAILSIPILWPIC